MVDLSWLPALVVSVVTLIGGAVYAQKKGLPDLAARADRETTRLITALEGQLAVAKAELTKLRPELLAAQARIEALEAEVDRLERRVVKLIIRIASLEDQSDTRPLARQRSRPHPVIAPLEHDDDA